VSQLAIQSALELALAAMPELPTAWENTLFTPVVDVPWQKVNFLFVQPDDVTMDATFYRERGYMQLTLYYPLLTGSRSAKLRAELIRKTFPRGSTFSSNGITTVIDRTPEIGTGVPHDESYVVIVRVPFYADIYL